MRFNELLKKEKLTIYKLSKKSGIPYSTLFDIETGKSKIEDCRGRILYLLAQSLNVTIEDLILLEQEEYNKAYEDEVPPFLKESLMKVKKYRSKENDLFDCYLDELNSSINVSEVENLISKEQASYLRVKYLED